MEHSAGRILAPRIVELVGLIWGTSWAVQRGNSDRVRVLFFVLFPSSPAAAHFFVRFGFEWTFSLFGEISGSRSLRLDTSRASGKAGLGVSSDVTGLLVNIRCGISLISAKVEKNDCWYLLVADELQACALYE